MCGLVGIFEPLRPATPSLGRLRAMADAVSHRGPDGEGFHAEPHLGLGHRRLSFVDLAAGAQPMATPDGEVTVAFNGEIYNHGSLRRELEALGHRHRTRSDTECLLHGWRAWGPGLLDRLTGMFAIALWDRGKGELLLARDRLGEKPLHYAPLPEGGLGFASELGALFALPAVSRGIDPAAIEDYLALGYIPDPATAYAGIRRLPAAHMLLLRRGRALELAPRRYWQAPRRAARTSDAAPAALANRLEMAVRGQLMADVPIGAFLSGGVDSASVVALAAPALATSGQCLSTFTIGFPGPDDERPAAAELAARFATRHEAEAGPDDYLAAADEVAAIFQEPFGDHSAVPTLAVCRLARRRVKGALSGDGGDEVFGGYRRHRFHVLASAARRLLPAPVRREVVGRLASLYPKLDRAPRWLRAKHTLTEISLDAAVAYYRSAAKLQDEARRGLLSAPLRAALDGHDPSARFAALIGEADPDDPLLQAQYADIHTYLPGDILVKTDRTSMAVSLELRAPLLDHGLVSWGMSLPARDKMRGGHGKRVLREAMAGRLPADLLWGRKRGFADSLAPAFRARAEELSRRLSRPALRDAALLDAGAVRRLVEEHASGARDHAQPLWQLLVLEAWLTREAAGAAPVPAAA
ncbi:MAG: asparagine synthase (glutamine-hydrolyzing) [Acetobacteraceae bacterium]|nr:asparagine synthase (glutamine-hydrolyzing) [Acetobacteraceae bacterium]